MFIGDESDDLIYDRSKSPPLHQAFPGVRPPSLAKRTRFMELHEIEIKEGKFKSYEDKIIKKNFEEFLEFYKIQDSTATRCALFGWTLDDPQSTEIVELVKKLIKPCGFYFRLANDLPNRLISAVYARARKLFNPFRKQKDVDTETKKDIIEYAKSVGKERNLYVHIANEFDIDPSAARRMVRRRTDLQDETSEYRTGSWKRKENIRLLDAICRNLNIEPDQITRQDILEGPISWVEVSKDMRTRCPVRCQDHSLNILITNLPAMKCAVIRRRFKKEKSHE